MIFNRVSSGTGNATWTIEIQNLKNCLEKCFVRITKKWKEKIISLKEDSNYMPGIVKSWAPEQTLELSKVPEYVKRQVQKILSIKKKG